MKKILYIIGMAVAMSFASCHKDELGSVDLTTANGVNFSAESIAPLTRVTGTSWEEGDAIAISAVSLVDFSVTYDNVKYLAKEGGTTVSFTPDSEVIYPSEDVSEHVYVAYYPYHEGWSFEASSMILDISGQDGTIEEQNKIDLLESSSAYSVETETVEFQFSHSLSRVQITASNFDELSLFEDLSSLTATLYTTSTHYNAYEGEIMASADAQKLGMVKSMDGDNAIFTVIIAPGEVADEVMFSDGNTYYTAPLSIESAEAGYQYNFKATVGNQGLTVLVLESDGVTDWDSQTGDDTFTTEINIVDGVYEIYTATGLKLFADLANSGNTSISGKLMNSIDLGGSASNKWTPIGSSSNQYAGTFDGGGYEVSGLYINNSSDYQALFGYTSRATISNLGVDGSVTGGSNVGGVVGYAPYTSIINCYNKANVSGNQDVGGVVGYLEYTGASVINCYNSGTVTGGSSGFNVGGVVGCLEYAGASVINCYNSGTVTGGSSAFNVGGVVGYVSNNSTVTSCYNSANVSAPSYVGGIAGQVNSSATVTSCYYDSSVYSGDGIGYGTGDVTGFATADMQSTRLLYRLNNAAYTYNQTNPSVEANGWKEVSSGYPVFDSENEPSYTQFDIGYDATNSVYQIYSGDGLRLFADFVNGTDQSVSEVVYDNLEADVATYFNFGSVQNSIYGKLMNDIDLEGTEDNQWTPIGGSSNHYQGVFDGGNYAISNLYINGSSNHQAIFGYIESATISNLGVSSGSVTASQNSAAIAGYALSSTITNCYNKANIYGSSSQSYVGGIVGNSISNSLIENCYNAGRVEGGQYIGGIAGRNTVLNSSDTGSKIANCYNEGVIVASAAYNVGGIAGDNYYSTVENCYNAASVTGTGVFYTSSTSGGIGGIVGYNNTSATVSNCYNIGVEITSTSTTDDVSDCAGAVVGYNNGSITSCYYNSEIYEGSGVAKDYKSSSTTVYGKSTSVMTGGTFAATLGSDYWMEDTGINDGYPILIWQSSDND